MTARVDLQSKVPVSLETGVSYFSQYHAVVKRSIWDPLAPGILGGAADLAGRAVVLTTVLFAGYLIVFIASIPFWYQTLPRATEQLINELEQIKPLDDSCSLYEHLRDLEKPDDISTMLHTPYQSNGLSSCKEKILQLCDLERLNEENCIYTEDLSGEEDHIRKLMLKPATQPLLEFIKEEKETFFAKGSRRHALGALLVVLGIKPALALFEAKKELDKDLLSILKKLAEQGENLVLKRCKGSVVFVNEQPIPSFNPRYFLNLSPNKSLTEAVALCFTKRADDANQFVNYLLGYGPAWEAFAANLGCANNAILPVFNNNHYYEIGKVLNQVLYQKNEDRSEIEKLGFSFHSQFPLLLEQGYLNKNESKHQVEQVLYRTGAGQKFDGLTARTDYFKKSYTLKKWVMETYFSSLV